MGYVTVLNFSSGEVCIYKYTDEDLIDTVTGEETSIEEWFSENHGHAISECQWMCTDELNLKIQ